MKFQSLIGACVFGGVVAVGCTGNQVADAGAAAESEVDTVEGATVVPDHGCPVTSRGVTAASRALVGQRRALAMFRYVLGGASYVSAFDDTLAPNGRNWTQTPGTQCAGLSSAMLSLRNKIALGATGNNTPDRVKSLTFAGSNDICGLSVQLNTLVTVAKVPAGTQMYKTDPLQPIWDGLNGCFPGGTSGETATEQRHAVKAYFGPTSTPKWLSKSGGYDYYEWTTTLDPTVATLAATSTLGTSSASASATWDVVGGNTNAIYWPSPANGTGGQACSKSAVGKNGKVKGLTVPTANAGQVYCSY